MAELPSKVPLTSHPSCLRIIGPSIYEDENQRTWLYSVLDKGGRNVKLWQVNMPKKDIAPTTSPQTSSTMPSMLILHSASLYQDSMGRFWRIVYHVQEEDMEDIILELMEGS